MREILPRTVVGIVAVDKSADVQTQIDVHNTEQKKFEKESKDRDDLLFILSILGFVMSTMTFLNAHHK